MVFYRKYRPQLISELDLAQVREKLASILNQKDIPHALLFTGPKGLGKTSSARIFAKAINCEKKSDKNFEPCNTCDNCVSITNGSAVDVLEIDAASNRGIDEIRELRERIKYSPAQLRKKVYIIDEVHMLTTEAFNALLKTLEEPPNHVLFVLCTTEEWKIPSTILSRTFHVRFEKPSTSEVITALMRVVAGEKLAIDEEVIEKIVTLADGAFRDAHKILEELVLQSNGKKITTDTINHVFKVGSIEKKSQELITTIAEKDMQKSLAVIQEIAELGIDFKVVHEVLVDILHTQLLIKAKLSPGIELPMISLQDIKKLLQLVNISYTQLRFTVLPQLPLEIAVMDYFYTDISGESLAPVQKNDTPKPIARPVVAVHETVRTTDVKEVSAVIDPEEKEVVVTSEIKDLFYQLIDRIKVENQSVAGILRGCQLISSSDGKLVVAPKFKFHEERLSDAKVKQLIEKHASEILNQTMKLAIQSPV